ncbi:uncharacterized protein [Odocoileus virginianus]|uniref:Uncharacterized protein n=1 Tax=Odocoileus virginianus TaxID=9874 RepID=A0ABM4IJG2_ODOVR
MVRPATLFGKENKNPLRNSITKAFYPNGEEAVADLDSACGPRRYLWVAWKLAGPVAPGLGGAGPRTPDLADSARATGRPRAARRPAARTRVRRDLRPGETPAPGARAGLHRRSRSSSWCRRGGESLRRWGPRALRSRGGRINPAGWHPHRRAMPPSDPELRLPGPSREDAAPRGQGRWAILAAPSVGPWPVLGSARGFEILLRGGRGLGGWKSSRSRHPGESGFSEAEWRLGTREAKHQGLQSW